MVEQASLLLADAPPTFALAGFSLGGYLSLEILKQAPKRVTHLALISTQARADSESSSKKRLEQINFVQRRNTLTTLTRAMCSTLVHSKRLESDDAAGKDDAETMQNTLLRMAVETGAETFVAQHQAAISRADHRDTLSEWAQLRRPALVVGGCDDGLIPHANHIEMNRLIREHRGDEADGASSSACYTRLLALENCGHMSCLEKPEEVAEAMGEWIQQPVFMAQSEDAHDFFRRTAREG